MGVCKFERMSVAITEIKEKTEEYFVQEGSIVRQIWGKSDTILVIFAGAAAEFALSKAVDWLYFTRRLPSDPLGRLFTTVTYAKKIVFSKQEEAIAAIDTINSIHRGVEVQRDASIPDWAFRDVLFMLIDYSIRSFELLERSLTLAEKREVFQVFISLGKRMKIKDLPQSFEEWEKMRTTHLKQNLEYSHYTQDLFLQYRKHLGTVHHKMLLELQTIIVPEKVHELMKYRKHSLLKPLISLYKVSRKIQLDWILKNLIFPTKYIDQIKALDD